MRRPDPLCHHLLVFWHYRRLIQLRRENDVMVYGRYQLLLPGDEQWLIACNFHDVTRDFTLERSGEVLLSNYKDTPEAGDIRQLRPCETVIYRMR